ncbi:tripartite tricarboxylate transporter substrate binding protein [Arthrobacter pigmenti]
MPFAPGGSSDMTSRALAQSLEDELGVSVAVTNKPGANGGVGTEESMNGPSDGYNTLFSSQSLFSITPLFVEDAPPVGLDEMQVVSSLTQEGYVMVVNAESEYKDLETLLKKDRIRYATSGVGSGSQFSSTALFAVADANAEDVPFEGGNPAVTSLMGGHTDATTVQIAEALPRIEDGSFRPLVVFSEERSQHLPDVPTAKELGYDFSVVQRRWLAVPEGTSQEKVETLRDAVHKAKDSDKFQEFLKTNYIDEWNVEPKEIQQVVEADSKRYQEIAKESGIGLAGSGK